MNGKNISIIGLARRGRPGNIELLVDGDQFFPYFVDSILDAKQSIKMRTYIFDRDDYAIKLADLLKRRSKDIDIKIMLDGLGSIMAQRKSAGTMPPDHKAPLGITTYLMKKSNLKVRNLTNPWFTGDHTKSTIIDSKTAYLGGMNIGREYRWEWHDLMMKIQGPVVNDIEHEFDKAWAHSSILGDFVFFWHVLTNSVEESLPNGYPIRVLKTSPVKSDIYKAQLAATRRAKSYIYIENAYFSDVTILYELVRARLRGVDVRVIIPMEGNHGVMNDSNVIAANTLIKYGAKVYAYPGMSHVKAAIYDGWACLGSANFDKFSFRVNREMNLATSESSFAEELKEDVFKPDFERSLLLTKPLPAGWRNTFAFIVASQL